MITTTNRLRENVLMLSSRVGFGCSNSNRTAKKFSASRRPLEGEADSLCRWTVEAHYFALFRPRAPLLRRFVAVRVLRPAVACMGRTFVLIDSALFKRRSMSAPALSPAERTMSDTESTASRAVEVGSAPARLAASTAP
jgi:hypothetical protein